MNSSVVIMSVYFRDSPLYLKLAIDSMLNQSTKSDLFIYCDGELGFRLSRLLEIYSLKHDNIRLFINEINHGLANSLNFLIDEAVKLDYNYIIRMDSDDISSLERTSKQLTYLKNNKEISVLGGACKEFGASFALDKKTLPSRHEDLVNFSITRCPFIHPTVVFRRNVFDDGHRYPVDTFFTEDMGLWFQLLFAGYKFANLDDVLLDYRMNEATVYRRKGIMKGISELTLRTKYMFYLNRFSLVNFFLITSRIIFHILPPFLLKIAYKNRTKSK